jgi:hypothetical protein
VQCGRTGSCLRELAAAQGMAGTAEASETLLEFASNAKKESKSRAAGDRAREERTITMKAATKLARKGRRPCIDASEPQPRCCHFWRAKLTLSLAQVETHQCGCESWSLCGYSVLQTPLIRLVILCGRRHKRRYLVPISCCVATSSAENNHRRSPQNDWNLNRRHLNNHRQFIALSRQQ